MAATLPLDAARGTASGVVQVDEPQPAHHLVGRVLAADLRVQPPLRLEPNHRRPQPDTAALRVWPTSAAAAADLLVVAAMLGLDRQIAKRCDGEAVNMQLPVAGHGLGVQPAAILECEGQRC